MIRSAVPIACAPAAQAETVPKDWPRRSCFIAITPEAALAISSGIESGEMRSAPSSRMMMWFASSVPIPPIPVPITEATRSGSYGGSPSQPASSIASAAAASASWVKRSERRTSLVERCSLGSNSLARPNPSSIPDTPALQRSCSVRAPTPRGVTAPTPVMTTDRVIRASIPPGRLPAGRS